MNLVEFTKEVVLSLVEDKDIVAVKEFEANNDHEILIEVMISEQDMPRLIGKKGKVINSLRTIVQASSYLKDNKIVKINIDRI